MTDNPKSNRREFLFGQSALDALRGKVGESLEDNLDDSSLEQPAARDRRSCYLAQYSKNAMACEFELLFNLDQYPQSGSAAMEAFQLIDLLEDQMTVYRDHSDVSQINRLGFEAPLQIEQRLFDLLVQAVELHELTGHAFDITSTPLTSVWGFDRRQGELPSQPRIDEALDLVGSEFIELDSESKSIRFLKQGVGINLGGIGKGHALDRVTELFADQQVHDFVIHGGQSSVVARGSSSVSSRPGNEHSVDQRNDVNQTNSSTEADGSAIASTGSAREQSKMGSKNQSAGWTVGITHPTLPGVRLAEIDLKDQSLATSGTGRQGFFHQGRRYGHIIDPRTGWPTSHFLSTTVVSQSAAYSDALATAFFVMTLDEVAELCDALPDVTAILISNDSERKNQCRLDCFNLDESRFRVLS